MRFFDGRRKDELFKNPSFPRKMEQISLRGYFETSCQLCSKITDYITVDLVADPLHVTSEYLACVQISAPLPSPSVGFFVFVFVFVCLFVCL